MKTFITIWFGQFVSQIGTAMTRFALLIWAYQQTGNATTVALLGFFAFLPPILVSPFAGVWIDRIDRRKILLLTDLGAGLMTIGMLLLYRLGQLEIWHLYLAQALTGAFEAFQRPAFQAASSTLLPKEQYSRANGLRSLAEFSAQVLAPILSGLVLFWVGIAGVMAIDTATFFVALVTLLIVRLPAVTHESVASDAVKPAFREELRVGFRYIRERRGLLGLAALMTVIEFLAALTWFAVLPAMILARSGNNELALSGVQGGMGIAGVLGGLLVSIWGGPKRKVRGFLFGIAFSFLLGDIPLAVGRSLPVWIMASAAGTFFIPILGSAHEALWQSKVSPAVQGRVFAARNMVTQSLVPLGYLLGGTLADHLLEPAMQVDGWLASSFGWLVGTGPGTGMALMFVGSAICAIILCVVGYRIPAIRNLEDDLPDHNYVASRTAIQVA